MAQHAIVIAVIVVLFWPTMLHFAWLSWVAELAWLGLLCFGITRLLRRPNVPRG